MLKLTNLNQYMYKFNLKDKTILLYTTLSVLLLFQNIVFFFDKDYKYNIFTILSFIVIFLYFNNIKIAIISAIFIVNIYYLLYKNIYESFTLDAANTACSTLTEMVMTQYDNQANEKYYEYCELSGLKKALYEYSGSYGGNLTMNGGVMYPYDAFKKPINHFEDKGDKIEEINKSRISGVDVSYHRHDLSFRQWMIYNYELPKNDTSIDDANNGDYRKYGTFAEKENDITNGDINIIPLTDAYIKSLQDRDVVNCESTYDKDATIDTDTLIKLWEKYDKEDTGKGEIVDTTETVLDAPGKAVIGKIGIK